MAKKGMGKQSLAKDQDFKRFMASLGFDDPGSVKPTPTNPNPIGLHMMLTSARQEADYWRHAAERWKRIAVLCTLALLLLILYLLLLGWQ